MSLTEKTAKNASQASKIYRLTDGFGLYLEVHPNGSKYWRWKFRFAGKEKRLALGVYPAVSVADARIACQEARQLLRRGVDPSVHRRMTAGAGNADAEHFETLAREWLAKRLSTCTPEYVETVRTRLEHNVFPWIGARAMRAIEAPELLLTLRRVEARGAVETAHRIRGYCGSIFRYAIATGRADRDPAADLRDALQLVKEKHHASVQDPRAIGELMRAAGGYTGTFVVRCALRLAPLVFVRPGELRHAEWIEFDLDSAEWRIPAERMKMKVQHIVPLSVQAVTVLRELRPLTGRGRFVFPSVRTSTRPMSENTVNGALRRLGYGKDEMTGHGFRSMASTMLNEHGWLGDAIERQLAHGERDDVRGAYNYAQHLPERRKMMQWWADKLDELAQGAPGAHLKAA